MMRIETGKGTIPLLSLLAIWSISLVVNLPGLAVSPLLGELDKVFPRASQLEIQLLTVIPNLIIIPFVLLSGKLAESRSKVLIVIIALAIYLASGLLYLLASSMGALIAVSALLGLGCGLLIPLAASLLADAFTGKYRMQQLGIKSAIANLSLVLATLLVGWLGSRGIAHWRLPFLVYLIPVVPLALSAFLPRPSKSAFNTLGQTPVPQQRQMSGAATGINWRKLAPVMALYFFVCYATVSIAYNLPFLMQQRAMGSDALGVVTALFFLAIFVPGLALPWVVRRLKQQTSWISLATIAVGSLVVGWSASVEALSVGAILMGLGLGILQPLMYDKGVECATSDKKVTLALSFVLATNYVAVAAAPLLVDAFASLVGYAGNNVFPFVCNGILAIGVGLVSILWRTRFVFAMNESYL